MVIGGSDPHRASLEDKEETAVMHASSAAGPVEQKRAAGSEGALIFSPAIRISHRMMDYFLFEWEGKRMGGQMQQEGR
jgi:hypothetical protein